MWHDFLAIQLILLQEYIDYAVRPSPYPSSLEKNIQFDSTNWSFCLFQTRFLQATQAVKIQFEIDKKIQFVELDFSNQIFQKSSGDGLGVSILQGQRKALIFFKFFGPCKDHLISKCPLDVFKSTKKFKKVKIESSNLQYNGGFQLLDLIIRELKSHMIC